MKEIKIMIVCILTLLMLTSCTGQNIYPSSTPDTQQIIGEASDESNSYYDIIKPDIDWVKLSRGEKLKKAQQMVEIEKKNLGITNTIILITSHNTDAFYSTQYNNGYIIHINPDYFDSKSPSECIQIICQQTYGIYQIELINQYLSADDNCRNLVCYDKAKTYLQELFRTNDKASNKSVSQYDREHYYKERYETLYKHYLVQRKGDQLISDRL